MIFCSLQIALSSDINVSYQLELKLCNAGHTTLAIVWSRSWYCIHHTFATCAGMHAFQRARLIFVFSESLLIFGYTSCSAAVQQLINMISSAPLGKSMRNMLLRSDHFLYSHSCVCWTASLIGQIVGPLAHCQSSISFDWSLGATVAHSSRYEGRLDASTPYSFACLPSSYIPLQQSISRDESVDKFTAYLKLAILFAAACNTFWGPATCHTPDFVES